MGLLTIEDQIIICLVKLPKEGDVIAETGGQDPWILSGVGNTSSDLDGSFDFGHLPDNGREETCLPASDAAIDCNEFAFADGEVDIFESGLNDFGCPFELSGLDT